MAEITIGAKIENMGAVTAFINNQLAATQCGAAMQQQIEITIEEIFTNIAKYAYNTDGGQATIRCLVEKSPLQVTLEFLDQGRPYNPLLRQDPDITLSAEDRQVGGLGLLMVKKMMDSVEYKYEAGKNILTVKKKLHKNATLP